MSTSSTMDRDELCKWISDMYSAFTSCSNAHTAEAIEDFWDTYALDRNVIVIRPSTNPMDLQVAIDMATSKDITGHSGKVLEIKHVKEFCNGQAAVVVFEGSQVFTYKGTLNDDNAMYSATIEKQTDGSLKLVFLQRYPGTSNLPK